MQIPSNEGLLEDDRGPFIDLLRKLYTEAKDIRDNRRVLSQIDSEQRARIVKALEIIAGRTVTERDLERSARRKRNMFDKLVREFVLGEFEHQYGSDGSCSDTDVVAQMLMAFFPNMEFGADEVLELRPHSRIDAMRCWMATFMLVTTAWDAGHLLDEAVVEREVRLVKSTLERELFATPAGRIFDWRAHVRYDSDKGFNFGDFDERSEDSTVIFTYLPRFIAVEGPMGRVYVRVLFQVRDEKAAESDFNKRVRGRQVGDDLAVRLIFINDADYELAKPTLDAMFFARDGSVAHTIEGVATGKKTRNGHSKEHPGVRWKGTVKIEGVSHNAVELQCVTYAALWDRNYAIGPDSDAFYKVSQWLLQDSTLGVAPIQVVFPPSLFNEWSEWEVIVEVIKMRLIKRIGRYLRNERRAYDYAQRVGALLLRQPWNLTLTEAVLIESD